MPLNKHVCRFLVFGRRSAQNTIITCYDVERGFSIYKNILSDRRWSL